MTNEGERCIFFSVLVPSRLVLSTPQPLPRTPLHGEDVILLFDTSLFLSLKIGDSPELAWVNFLQVPPFCSRQSHHRIPRGDPLSFGVWQVVDPRRVWIVVGIRRASEPTYEQLAIAQGLLGGLSVTPSFPSRFERLVWSRGKSSP